MKVWTKNHGSNYKERGGEKLFKNCDWKFMVFNRNVKRLKKKGQELEMLRFKKIFLEQEESIGKNLDWKDDDRLSFVLINFLLLQQWIWDQGLTEKVSSLRVLDAQCPDDLICLVSMMTSLAVTQQLTARWEEHIQGLMWWRLITTGMWMMEIRRLKCLPELEASLNNTNKQTNK